MKERKKIERRKVNHETCDRSNVLTTMTKKLQEFTELIG